MMDSRTAEAFLNASLFASVDPEELTTLAEQSASLELAAGETLFREGESADAVYLILEGQLQALSEVGGSTETLLGILGPGEPVGELAVLLGGNRSATVRATSRARLARIDVDTLKPWLERSPALQQALEGLARERLRRNQLSAIIRRYFGALTDTAQAELAESLEWLTLAPGEILFRRGDPGESLYIVVSGQLWAVGEDEAGNDVPIATLSEQDVVGEMGLLSHDSRSAGVVAAQDSTLVRLSRTTFEALSADYPNLMLTITRELIAKLRRTQRSRQASRGGSREIAVVAGDQDLPLIELLDELVSRLSSKAILIDRRSIRQRLGRSDLADAEEGSPDHVGLGVWLDEQATVHDMVIYLTDPLQSDGRATAWTRHCLTRADEILIVADASGDAAPRDLERALYEERQTSIGLRSMPRTRLLLLHESRIQLPRQTTRWLESRSPDGHFHLRRDNEADLARAARILENRAIGLVLGGHGVGGLAQVGALRALEESGIDIDILAGSGIGAMIAALKARGMSATDMMKQVNWQRLVRPGDMPHMSRELLGDVQIEDLWHGFSCSSINLSRQDLSIHRSGSLSKAVMAAMAMPGLHSPVIFGEELHMDGGLFNQYPTHELFQQAARCISIDSVSASGPRRSDLEATPSVAGEGDGFWRRLTRRFSGRGLADSGHRTLLMEAVMAGSSRAVEQLRAGMDLSVIVPVDDRRFLRPGAAHPEEDSMILMEDGYRQGLRQLKDLDADSLAARFAV